MALAYIYSDYNSLIMYYFASDFHLGYPDYDTSRQREQRLVQWLDFIKQDAKEIHLVGDIFDFWFEWKKVIPKYFTRFLGKLAELSDSGIKIHFYIGNHDIWTFGYLEKEIGLIVHKHRQIQLIEGKKFLIEHGDQTPYESKIYRAMTALFRNPLAQKIYASILHPNTATKIATSFSHRRDRYQITENLNPEKDKQIRFVHWLQENGWQADYYIFGHRHLAYTREINGSILTVLGEWMIKNTYAVFDGKELKIQKWQ